MKTAVKLTTVNPDNHAILVLWNHYGILRGMENNLRFIKVCWYLENAVMLRFSPQHGPTTISYQKQMSINTNKLSYLPTSNKQRSENVKVSVFIQLEV